MTGDTLAAFDLEALGRRIRERRREWQLSQRQVAEAAGISRVHLSDVECARTRPSWPVMATLLHLLDLLPEVIVPASPDGPGPYGKYIITRADGIPIPAWAQHFVLRYDTDRHARVALAAYAESVSVDNPRLADDLRGRLAALRLNPYWARPRTPCIHQKPKTERRTP